jgi:hypothetical protein
MCSSRKSQWQSYPYPNEVLVPENIDDNVGNEGDETGELNDLFVNENDNKTIQVDDRKY